MISPHINPTTKKKELETLDIIVVVDTMLLVMCLVSGKTSEDGVHAVMSDIIIIMDLPGFVCDSPSELQRSRGFGCQVPFGWQSAICSLSS